MPNCSICGQPVDKLPNWLDEVEIAFRCAACAELTTQALAEKHAAEADHDDDENEDGPEGDEEEEEEQEEEEDSE